MHRALSMKLGPLNCVSRLSVPPRASSNRPIAGFANIAGCRPLQQQQQQQQQQHQQRCHPRLLVTPGGRILSDLSSNLTIARGICSTPPAWKGRRGGASALIPKRTRPFRKKVPGEGKKKKPKVHGAPMSNIYRERELEEEDKKKLEAIAAIPPEEQARIHKMTEEFLNNPIGQQDLGVNAFLRKRDPDAMMLNLGMTLSDVDARKNASHLITSGTPSSPLLANGSPSEFDGLNDSSLAQEGLVAEGVEPTQGPGSSAMSSAGSVLGYTGGSKDFNLLIRTLAAHGRGREARERVMPEMRRRGIALNAHTYSALLAGAAIERDTAAAEELWAQMLRDDVKPEARSWSSRVNAHARAGRMKAALAVGKQMREAGHPWCVVTYTSLIAGCVRRRDYQGAWQTWKDMIIWGNKPDVMTYTTMIKLCADTHQYERAMGFLSDMDMEDQSPSRVTMETLFRAAATAPQWIRAYGTIVDDLVERFIGLGLTPEEDTYRALLVAYGSGGDADKVLQCIEEAHLLRGHISDNLGDGTPKLSWETYCASLEAIAKCCSVGRHRGTRPRWGIMPGQDHLIMDIGPLQVPEEDADRVKQMQMAGMEWDEDGEAALRKGFRKGTRKRFMGVYTPKELVGDDEFERDIEREYERVMAKAKRMKQKAEREKLIRLGRDPDEDAEERKVRPLILPDPEERAYKQAPLPSWLQSSLAPPSLRAMSAAAPGRLDGEEAQPATTIGIGDGREEELMDWGDGSKEVPGFDAGVEEGWTGGVSREGISSSGYEAGPRRKEILKEREERGNGVEAWQRGGHLGSDDEAVVGDDVGGGSSAKRDERRRVRGLQENNGGILRPASMLDIVEGNLPRGRDELGKGLVHDEESGELVFPPNMNDIMSEMRALAQQDLDRREKRHKHLQDDDGDEVEDDIEESQDEGYDEVEEEFERDGFGGDMTADTADGYDGEEAEAQARGELERMIARQSHIGDSVENDAVERLEADELWGRDSAEMPEMFSQEFSGPGAQETLLEHLEGLEGSEKQPQEDEDDGWTPLMHTGLKDRTAALFGVVRMLEADAMEAARKADEEMGFPREGDTAGPAVHATLRARLRCLTEARRCVKAIEFVEKEYPKEGAKLNNKDALLIVDMYINTRGVGLAEAFENKCRAEYGLPPDRRIIGAILNARAKRAYAWSHEVPHVTKVLDLLQQYKIKPHENELRFVRKLVDKGKLSHSWLPADPEANVKRLRLAVKRTKPVNKAYFKVVNKIKHAKYMIGSRRSKGEM